jgi:segregation and condensation protein B
MTKKRKRTRNDAPAQSAAANEASPAEVALEAVTELTSTPTRTGRALEEFEDSFTRTGRQLEDADAAVVELADDDAARTSLRVPSAAAASSASADIEPAFEEGGSDDHRFDFGSEQSKTGPVPPGLVPELVPPDPGSADAASPRLQSIVESLLFAADRPLGLRQLADLVEEPEIERVRSAVVAVGENWRERGVQLHEVAGGYQFRTHPANAFWVQKLLQQKPVRLSRALLETLAICSYRQPITRPEIDEIRGVDSGGTLKTLMDRALVRILGKREEPGRPLLYGTTKEFLEFFSLRDLKDLPTLREYHELSEEHRAQVAALESKAPEGTILAEGEEEDTDAVEALPRLSRLEITVPKEDAAELAEIDLLIRTAGASIPTDSDLPPGAHAADGLDSEELVVTGRFEPVPRPLTAEAASEFDAEHERTGLFGDPLLDNDAGEMTTEFEREDPTRLRPGDVDAGLVDDRDPEKEPQP